MSMGRSRCGILDTYMRRLPLVVAAVFAAGFSTQGNRWPNQAGQPVTFMINPAGAPGIGDTSDDEAIRRAFGTWDSVACSFLQFQEQPWVEPAVVAADGVNRIFWVTEGWPQDQRTTIALTFTFYRTDTHVITDADISNNAVYYMWTTTDSAVSQTTVDVETILFHEIGHFVGLDHSQDPQAAMFASNNKLIQRGPAQDDVNGVCSLYHNGQPPPDVPQGGSPVGAPCQAAQDCASRLCADDPLVGRAYCTAPCQIAEANACPAGYQCTTTGQGDYCLAPVVTDELCDQCQGSNQCSSGLCLTVPGYNYFQPFCTRACDPTNGVPGQCPNGYSCVTVYSQGQTGGVCAPSTGVCNPTGKGGHGEPCFANGGCKANHVCVDYFGDGAYHYCYLQCPAAIAGQPCYQGAVCYNIAAQPGVAACLDTAQVGRPCIPEQCVPGSICAWDETQGIDSALCYQQCPQGGCPANTQCQNIPGVSPLCLPNDGFLPLGAACQSDAECESRTCRNYGDDRLCSQVCTNTDPASCPNNFRCIAPTGSTEGLCWPVGFIDANAQEVDRRVTVGALPPDFCICDTTSQCDDGCGCDPECVGGCSCTTASRSETAWWTAILIALAWISRRRGNRAS
jgi:uncharacterized protein (TIGR03382 family)